MNTLIPTPDNLLVPPGYFQFFLFLLFPIHLLFMNFMVGAAAVSFYAHIKKEEISRRLAHELARLLPILVAFAVNFGVGALLFLQVLYGQFFYSSSVLMGAFWLSVILLVMSVYYLLYIYDFRFVKFRGGGRFVIASAVLLLLVIPFLFTNNMTLMLRPEAWTGYFTDPHGTILNLHDPTLIPRYLHMVIGALAVGGLFVAGFGRYLGRKDSPVGKYATDLGMRVFAYLTLVQVMVGIFFLISFPENIKLMFLGGNRVATGIFLAAFLLALAALAAGFRRKLGAAVCAVLPLIYLMSFVRAYVRRGFLKPFFTLEQLEVVSRYSSMYAFFGVLIVGILVLAWLFWKARPLLAQKDRS
jgi:hypothetical protein